MRILSALVLLFTLAGCVSVQDASMPAAWPALARVARPEGIAGGYQIQDSSAAGSVRWVFFPQVKELPALTSELRLSVVDGRLLSELVGNGSTLAQCHHPFEFEQGAVRLTRTAKDIGEFALGTGSRTDVFILRRDTAGALIIESNAVTAGLGPAFIPVHSSARRWLRLAGSK